MSGFMPKPSFRHAACRLRRTNLFPRCLSKGFHADATNCKLVIVPEFTCFRLGKDTTIYGFAADKPYPVPAGTPPGFSPGFVLPHTASHPIGVVSLPIRILQGLLLYACTPIGRHGTKVTPMNVRICRSAFRYKENKVPERNPSQKNCPLSHASRSSVRKVSNIIKATLTAFYSIKVASHKAGNSPAYFYSLNQASPYITKTFQTCCPNRTR